MIAHLARCAKLTWPDRYACDCGADAQNDLATKLDQAESTRKADAIDRRWGVDPESERRLDAMLRETQPAAVPPPDTPLRAVARMLDRLHARACHHDSPRHLLATAYAAVELAATLSPAEAIRVLDEVEAAEDDRALLDVLRDVRAKNADDGSEPPDVRAMLADLGGPCSVCGVSHDPQDCCQA